MITLSLSKGHEEALFPRGEGRLIHDLNFKKKISPVPFAILLT
jgi:hypothetical protein